MACQASMSTIKFQSPSLSCYLFNGGKSCRATFPKMSLDFPSSKPKLQEDLSGEIRNPPTPELQTSVPSNMRFDRLQTVETGDATRTKEFGRYVAREALIDEEYWTAAWLRAESHWENRPPERYMESFKRKHADHEFNALKMRCGKNIQKCSCIIAIKKQEPNVKRTVIKSIVGTLDLSIRNFSHGESFPEENVKISSSISISPMSKQKYGYVANLCVSKVARRKGIASNLLSFAIETAKFKGVEEIFVHVHKNNITAQDLYKKMGFQMVETASADLIEEENYLMRVEL